MYVHITIYILHVTNSNFDVEQMLSNKRCRQISTFIALRIRTPAPIKTMPSSLVPPPAPLPTRQMCPARVFDSKKAAPAPAEPSAPAPADADVPVCIDFLKGRCTRSRTAGGERGTQWRTGRTRLPQRWELTKLTRAEM